MADKLITIAQYLEPFEAELFRNRLEEEGIRASVTEYAVVDMAWYLSLAVGGIKLLVFDKDAGQAREIILEMQEELAEARRLNAAAAEEQEKELESQQTQTSVEEEQDENEDQEDQWWNVESSDEPALPEDASPWTPPRAIDPPAAKAANLTREAADKDPLRAVEDEDSEELPVYNGREQLAWKACRTTILAFYSYPFHFYASYLIIRVLMDPRPLEVKTRQKFCWAVILNFSFWFLICLFLLAILLDYSAVPMYRGMRSDF